MTPIKWAPAVNDLVAELRGFAWFEGIGRANPTVDNPRVDFRWMVEHDAFHYAAWGDVLIRIEEQIDQMVLSRSALDLRDLVTQELKLSRVVGQEVLDRFFIGLDEAFGGPGDGFVAGMDLYPHEVVELPQRLVTYAGLERLLIPASDRKSVLNEALTFFARGLWPAGWQGTWPAGRMLIW